ncbi:MAG: phytoene desaturase, partial [Bacteroidetes bacterium]
MARHIAIIGSGFSGLSAACHLAKAGYEVTILEKNATIGGRARQFQAEGYTFDMGPSWYWMPDVFEAFYNDFGHTTSDFYELVRLDPSYRIVFGQEDVMDVPAGLDALYELFERYEPGSSHALKDFLAEARYKYEVGMREFVHKPSLSVMEFADRRILASVFRMQMFSSLSKQVRRRFRDPRLVQLLEFPVLFLGATPWKTPAMYSLMNYADMALGTWYPMGGMHRIVEAMAAIATELGVTIRTGVEVRQIAVHQGRAIAVRTDDGPIEADVVVGAADYHHVEQELLAPEWRQYDARYWENRTMAPSSLLFYLGVERRLDNLRHHTLFFDRSLDQHAREIYETPRWPSEPLFYACTPSITDPSVAPQGCENLFLLVPLAPGLEDSDALRENYYDRIMNRLERLTGQSIRPHVVYKRSYAMNDFVHDYHAFKGNAYGLANTLRQTAFLKP